MAGADGKSNQDDGVGVMMAMDKDEYTRQMERNAEAEVKRQQNALPAWHLKSTISGDLTALGVKENAREAAAAMSMAALAAEQMTNDDILKGLGVIGGSKTNGQNLSQLTANTVAEDVKPIINVESDCSSPFISLSRFPY